jgi:hypothetical protein
MKYEERYIVQYSEGAESPMEVECPDEATAARTFETAAKDMPSGSRLELRRHMTITLATAAKA